MAFAYSFFLCTSVKIYILTGAAILSAFSYLFLEHWVQKKAQENCQENNEKVITKETVLKKEEIKENNEKVIAAESSSEFSSIEPINVVRF